MKNAAMTLTLLALFASQARATEIHIPKIPPLVVRISSAQELHLECDYDEAEDEHVYGGNEILEDGRVTPAHEAIFLAQVRIQGENYSFFHDMSDFFQELVKCEHLQKAWKARKKLGIRSATFKLDPIENVVLDVRLEQ